jgi:hypothetical protein
MIPRFLQDLEEKIKEATKLETARRCAEIAEEVEARGDTAWAVRTAIRKEFDLAGGAA